MVSRLRKLVGTIESDTGILPYAVADGVIDEAETLVGFEIPNKESFVDKLEAKANEVYAHNSKFRSQIRGKGDRGRDQLYVWMRHWLTSDMRRAGLGARLPDSFAVGRFTSPSPVGNLPPGTRRG